MTVMIAFFLGLLIGGSTGALIALWLVLPGEEAFFQWRYECTCGWRCVYLASVTLAPSFVRCDDCKGIAVRRREPERGAS